MATCLEKTAEYIMLGDGWEKPDAIAERVWDRALVEDLALRKEETHCRTGSEEASTAAETSRSKAHAKKSYDVSP